MGDIVACVFGMREGEMLEEFWVLLNGLDLNVVGVFFDDIFAYYGVMAVDILCTGKWSARVFGVSI
jgi:IS1 family transposase